MVKGSRLQPFRFNVITAPSNQEGKSWARFNGLRHGNPGMKTQWARTDGDAAGVCGKWITPTTPSGSVFPPKNGSPRLDTAQFLAAKQVVPRRVLQQHNPPFLVTSGRKRKKLLLNSTPPTMFHPPCSFCLMLTLTVYLHLPCPSWTRSFLHTAGTLFSVV